MTKKVLIIIAEGSETVEIVAPVDTMRRVGVIKINKFDNYRKFKIILD